TGAAAVSVGSVAGVDDDDFAAGGDEGAVVTDRDSAVAVRMDLVAPRCLRDIREEGPCRKGQGAVVQDGDLDRAQRYSVQVVPTSRPGDRTVPGAAAVRVGPRCKFQTIAGASTRKRSSTEQQTVTAAPAVGNEI